MRSRQFATISIFAALLSATAAFAGTNESAAPYMKLVDGGLDVPAALAPGAGATVTVRVGARALDGVNAVHFDLQYDREGLRFESFEAYDQFTRDWLTACRRVLKPAGTYVLVGRSDPGRWLGLSGLVKTLASSPFTRRRMRAFVSVQNRDDLTTLKEMVEAGEIDPVIGHVFRLDEVPQALERQGTGHPGGKIVIAIHGPPPAPHTAEPGS